MADTIDEKCLEKIVRALKRGSTINIDESVENLSNLKGSNPNLVEVTRAILHGLVSDDMVETALKRAAKLAKLDSIEEINTDGEAAAKVIGASFPKIFWMLQGSALKEFQNVLGSSSCFNVRNWRKYRR